MANTDNEDSDGLSPARRKRLEQAFDHATKLMEKPEYDFNYVADLLGQCVAGDLGNPDHLTKFLENLRKKYNNNKKGAPFAAIKAVTAKGSIKKGVTQKDWKSVAKGCVELLKQNPWETAALTALGYMAEALGYAETEGRALRAALEAAPNDCDINKQCALYAARAGQYDQAIACWHRVEKAKPNDEEAPRQIAQLTVRKTMAHGGFEEEKTSRGGAGDVVQKAAQLSPEDRLKREIQRNPEEISNYLELAEIYGREDKYREAEAVLTKALEVSGDRIDVKERLEDAQLAGLQKRVRVAEEKARASRTTEDVDEYKRVRKKLKMKEKEIYELRCERYPANLGFRHELGLRYQSLGMYNEAIKQFQQARSDPRRKGMCLLALGQCFQAIKQARLAMNHYEQAVAEIPDRETDNKKLALYHAGRLALALRDKEAATNHLTALAQLDFSYRDVSDLLDKVEKLGEDSAAPSPPASEES